MTTHSYVAMYVYTKGLVGFVRFQALAVIKRNVHTGVAIKLF